MNWLPWILVVAVSYEVQCQTYSDRSAGQGNATALGFPSLFCFYNNKIYMAGQSFPSSDGCNTCTCSGHNRVLCTLRACLPESPCKVGQPHPDALCSNFGPIPFVCPDKYECVPNNVPGMFDAPGVCCLKVEPEQPQCKIGNPLEGVSCGGFRPTPLSCPDGYECVGEALAYDGPGVCCLKSDPDVCKLPSVTGRCRAFIPSWYYDYNEKKCKQFIYGGCGGNANRFETHAECRQRCGEEPQCKNGKPLPGRQCGGLLGRPCPPSHHCVGELVPVDGPGVCCPKDQDLCQLPSVTGPCRASFPRWYYDYNEKKCKEFIYGGCGGNANRFETKAECQQRCGEEQPQCKIGNPLEGVSCGGRPPIPCPDPRYECVGEALAYDGPGVCCLKSDSDLCKLPSVTGPCYAFIPSWYYDYNEKKCKQFIYGGCRGNANRFETQIECQRRCGEEPQCKNGKPLPGRQCGGLLGRPCPPSHQCVGELVPVDGPGVCCPKDQGPPNLVCPTLPPDTMGICVEMCSTNRPCPSGQLCCSNGCGHVCMGGIAQTHPLCPRLNPLVAARCIRFEQCPRQGCPGRQECCPSYCGTTCRALQPPCGIQPPLSDSSGHQLFCGRGPNRVDCPTGHYCAIHPADRYAVCCPYL